MIMGTNTNMVWPFVLPFVRKMDNSLPILSNGSGPIGLPNLDQLLGQYTGTNDGNYYFPHVGVDPMQISNKVCYQGNAIRYIATNLICDSTITRIKGVFHTNGSAPSATRSIFGANGVAQRLFLNQLATRALSFGIGNDVVTLTTILALNTQYQFEIFLTPTTWSVLLNGVEEGYGTIAGDINNGVPLFIGAVNSNNSSAASVSDFKIIYLGFEKNGQLVALYPMEDFDAGQTGVNVRDVVGGFDGTITNSTGSAWALRPEVSQPTPPNSTIDLHTAFNNPPWSTSTQATITGADSFSLAGAGGIFTPANYGGSGLLTIGKKYRLVIESYTSAQIVQIYNNVGASALNRLGVGPGTYEFIAKTEGFYFRIPAAGTVTNFVWQLYEIENLAISYRAKYGFTKDKGGVGTGYTMGNILNPGHDQAGDALDVRANSMGIILESNLACIYPPKSFWSVPGYSGEVVPYTIVNTDKELICTRGWVCYNTAQSPADLATIETVIGC